MAAYETRAAHETRAHIINSDKHGVMIVRGEYRDSRANPRNVRDVLKEAECKELQNLKRRIRELESNKQCLYKIRCNTNKQRRLKRWLVKNHNQT